MAGVVLEGQGRARRLTPALAAVEDGHGAEPTFEVVLHRAGGETTHLDGGRRRLLGERLTKATAQDVGEQPKRLRRHGGADAVVLAQGATALQVEALELRSGMRQEIEIKPQYGLTDEQVEQMLMDSLTHAREDVAARMLIEARTAAEQLLYHTAQFLKKHGQHLAEDEIALTNAHTAALRDTLNSQDKDAILRAADALDDATRPYAERVMDISVKQAMAGKQIG